MNTPMNSKTFEGKVALVTGGNSGIGLATAMLLNRQGAKVIVSGRDQNTLNEAAAVIGEGTLALRSDVNVLADLDALFTFVEKHAGKKNCRTERVVCRDHTTGWVMVLGSRCDILRAPRPQRRRVELTPPPGQTCAQKSGEDE